jgi:magnesium transporter
VIRVVYRSEDGQVHTDLSAIELETALRDAAGLLWVDLWGEPAEVCAPVLLETFGFHPLAVDDALEEAHVPKVDDWGWYLYLVLHAVAFDERQEDLLDTLELDLFLGQNFLVTHRMEPIAAVERVWEASRRDERQLQRGAAHLAYRVADELVADYLPAVERIDEAIDRIEDRVFDDPHPSLLEQIFTLKRALLRLRRIIAPQREVLNKLARADYAVVAGEAPVFFRDVYDHLVRLYDITESLRDLVGSALETYLSVVNNRMNEVMKVLTVITTLFMPISFMSGFFGMNFFQPAVPLEAWTAHPAFLIVLAAMILLPTGMLLWMRRRAWM